MDKHLIPLNDIALSISGGGFRAAAFGLGCLSYLNHSKKLENVSFMASASGGTIANLAYAHSQYREESFETFFKHLINFLDGEKALKATFDILENDRAWEDTPEKGRNLINAFAKAYHRDLFNEATWSDLFDAGHVKHLKQICANSTEFKNGLSFRFQNIDGAGRTGLVGNYSLFLKDTKPFDTLKKLRLGDITAASSCFPLGFEPLMFPQDFTYNNQNDQNYSLTKSELLRILRIRNAEKQIAINRPSEDKRGSGLELEITEKLEEAKAELTKDVPETEKTQEFSFGLMDGGIADNQAIHSLMLADNRHKNKFDTFIICDVSSPFMDGYSIPVEKKGFLNGFSLRFLGIIYVLTGITLISTYWWNISVTGKSACVALGTLLVALPIALSSWLYFKMHTKEAKKSTWMRMISKYIGYFFTIPVKSFSQMLRSRIKSTGIMVSDVFLKQIRRMWYDRFFENKEWENRRISVTVYELSTKHYEITASRIGENTKLQDIVSNLQLVPSEQMKNKAQIASDVDTTLWFDSNHIHDKALQCLISTGQFTMCYNLLIYLCKLEANAPNLINSQEFGELKERLLKDWLRFKENPEWLL